jgi:hypothetical protein
MLTYRLSSDFFVKTTMSEPWLKAATPELPQALVKELEIQSVKLSTHDLSSELATSERRLRIQSEILRLNEIGQKPLFTLTHDSTQPLSDLLEGEYFSFRTSMLPSLKYRNEMLMPAFLDEKEFADWLPLAKPKLPTVGFVGHAKASLQHEMITGNKDSVVSDYGFERIPEPPALRNPVNIGLILRQRVLAGLSRSERVSSMFILRDVNHSLAKAGFGSRRAEYLDNLNENLFAVCVRGAGNYSIRLYEALAFGRIPLILDSTMPLPLPELVDWDSISIRVPIEKIDSAGEVLASFYESKSEDELVKMQHRAREAWEKFLTRTNFFTLATPILIRISGHD